MSTPEKFDKDRISALLKLGLSDTPHHVTELASFLGSVQGCAWQAEVFASETFTGLVAEHATVEEWRALKDQGKRQLAEASTVEERRQATLCYFAAIGGALAYHGEVISHIEAHKFEGALMDLGEALEEPWGPALRRAAAIAGDLRGRADS